MITYNAAFDPYHAIYRMAHIVQRIDKGESFEVDRVRIWDFYLLFPDKLYGITLKQDEQELRDYRKAYIARSHNPYEYSGDNRTLFEWIKPFQLSALNCLVSYGILSRPLYLENRVSVLHRKTLDGFLAKAGKLSVNESNSLSFLGLLSRNLPLTGASGLKARTRLLESKYDAE
jgi:hypothetical protein